MYRHHEKDGKKMFIFGQFWWALSPLGDQIAKLEKCSVSLQTLPVRFIKYINIFDPFKVGGCNSKFRAADDPTYSSG
jgi:hypothetical protein